MSNHPTRRSLLGISACAMAAFPAIAEQQPSAKKGFGIALKPNPDWQAKLKKLNVNWFYTWGSKMPEGVPEGVEYIPMVWGRWSCNDSTMERLASEKHKTLLGFNEPDQHDQANMTVEQALDLWPKLMASGMRLGSPAGVHPDGEWMETFMKEVEQRGYRVDFIAIHSYYGKNPKHFLKRLEKIRKMYGRPIWITEFAVADWEAQADKPNRYSPEDAYTFMEAVLPALEKLDYVERYTWFSAPKPSHALAPSVLFNKDGSLTKLGRLYSSY
ncbi:MAG: glycoside hydrolase family protein [Verrucomicrobia bacterium]|nr:glycoside hydrolase family protein [Verrucomicrobiota bacterium]